MQIVWATGKDGGDGRFLIEKSMNYRPLSHQEIKKVELEVDTFFSQLKMPGRSIGEARWKTLTAAEDSVRLFFAGISSAWLDPKAFALRARFIHMADRFKYHLKYYLELIGKSGLDDDLEEFSKFEEDGSEYLSINKIMHHDADLYASAVGTFTSIWGGHRIPLGKISGNSILLPCDLREIQYRAIERLVAQHEDDFTPLPLLASIFAASSPKTLPSGSTIEWCQSIKEIVASTKVSNHSISYQFVTKRAKYIYDDLYHDPDILPHNWHFPWARAEDTVRFSTSLLAISFYHIIAVYFGAYKHSLRGAGINEVGLFLTPKKLAKRISAVADLTLSQAQIIVTALTYGNGTKTPDPALQPFIPVGKNRIFVPCMMIVSNHWSRNMMSLHARLNPSSFDSQSKVFEAEMIDRVLGHSVSRKVLTNKTLSDKKWREEIDLLYIDQKNSIILVCELKWSIPPGDPREIYNRRAAIDEKVKQVARKEKGVKQHISAILKQCGISHISGNWLVRSLVVTGGYSGHPSSLPYLIPIVPQAVFEKVISSNQSLISIHELFATPLWLPRPGIDFELLSKSDRVGKVEIHDFGYFPKNELYIDHTLAKYVEDISGYSSDELASVRW